MPDSMARCLYLHGFASGPGSHKAAWLGTRLARHGVEIEVPDLNAGDFSHLTLTRQMAVLDALLAGEPGPVTLIGSSFGGYLAALLAEQDPRVERLVLLAPAFGFGALLESLFGAETMARWQRDGSLQLPEAADAAQRALHYDLVHDLARHDATPFARQVPALVFHGIDDPTVPYQRSIDYLRENRAARVVLLADGHSLDPSLEVIWTELCAFLELEG